VLRDGEHTGALPGRALPGRGKVSGSGERPPAGKVLHDPNTLGKTGR
jgi:hypothetical protein